MNIIKLKKLPKLPEHFIPKLEECLTHVEDDKLYLFNRYRQAMNRAAPIPEEVEEWINLNIYKPYFSEEQLKDTVTLKNNLINQTKYMREHDGKHPIHVDLGRNYALNYYWNTGGDNTKVVWFDSDKKTVIYESEPIESGVWYLLKVKPEFHEVRGIDPGATRLFLTLGFWTEDVSEYDEADFFKSFLTQR